MKKAICLFAALMFLLTSCMVPADTSPATTQPSTQVDPAPFKEKGLYIWSDTPNQHDFWKACGFTVMQLCDLGWHRNAENGMLEQYTKVLANNVRTLQADGFKVYVILFANIKQYKGPHDLEPTGIGEKFHPSNEAEMEDRLFYLRKTVEACKAADGFTLFAGDPGGIPDSLGTGSVQDYINMALKVRDLVKEVAPQAEFNINTWAVSMFTTPNFSAGNVKFWTTETESNRTIVAYEGLLGEDTGLELPCHDYYRPMTLRLYHTNPVYRKDPPKYPSAEEFQAIRNTGAARLWAWPYFLLDEADDGDLGGAGVDSAMQIEVRYIHKLVNDMRELGFDGIIGSWSYAGYLEKALNTYAFARFADDANLTPEMVLAEYADYLTADEASAKTLVEIFKYIENQSNWHKKMPKATQLPQWETSITSPEQALEMYETITASERPYDFDLPEGSKMYLLRVKNRLKAMIK
ncbi:MAG: hypothetical protein IKD06_06680 [Clostridia bacterium]|nr:hypothetical protein [Clostridia bacterium]